MPRARTGRRAGARPGSRRNGAKGRSRIELLGRADEAAVARPYHVVTAPGVVQRFVRETVGSHAVEIEVRVEGLELLVLARVAGAAHPDVQVFVRPAPGVEPGAVTGIGERGGKRAARLVEVADLLRHL